MVAAITRVGPQSAIPDTALRWNGKFRVFLEALTFVPLLAETQPE
jgi:hypothetical protein